MHTQLPDRLRPMIISMINSEMRLFHSHGLSLKWILRKSFKSQRWLILRFSERTDL